MATIPSEDEKTLNIVPFEMKDLDQIMEIENVSFATPWSRESYLELAPLESISFFVVKLAEKVVGYMLYQGWADEIELHTIAVSPKHRRQGVGQRMIEFMIEDATSRGVRRIFLQVRPSNEAARCLYTGFGFMVVGVRPRYYRDNQEDALIMRLNLRL